jgi:heparosan-N-sulfate-glucuronate 5-epimerase
VGAAFSIGPGYEPQPINPAARYDQVSGYYLDLRQKAAAELRPRVTGRGQRMLPGPTAMAQRALGRHEQWLAGDERALEQFLEEIALLRRSAEEDRNALLWRYDVDVPKFRQRAPFYSCMAQGQAASAFVRAFVATGEEAWADAARAAIRPLVENGERLGLVTMTEAGPILEEAATNPPSHVLNGWIFGLWGLWDAATSLGEADARHLFDGSCQALAQMLTNYDVGWWTRYSLFPPVAPDLAKPFYHALHAAQMPALYEMSGMDVFRSAAARWSRYDRSRNRLRAVVLKAPAVLRGLRSESEWARSSN